MIGQHILNYKIEKLIGEGGMGKVFLAQHTQLNRKVAIKVLHSHLTYSQEFRNRFKTEANLLANLQHPNIVTLHDYIENNNFLALVMEYVQGISLDDYVKQKGYLSDIELLSLFHQVLDAFQFAHENGIIHRDIKPANIILTPDGKIKILDFGIAKIKGSLTHTQTGTQMGTILYMSPEQIKGQKVDTRSDIYSLGVTLFELATGRMPYDPNSSIYEVSNAIVHQPLPKPSSINPKISPFLENIIQKATEKNPDLRFQNCLEFKNALNPHKNKQSLTSSISFWFLIILLLAGIVFLAQQIYDNQNIHNHIAEQDSLDLQTNLDDLQDKKQLNENSTHEDITPAPDTKSEEAPLPSRDFTDLAEGKIIKDILQGLEQKLNKYEDFSNILNFKVKFNQQDLLQSEAYQKLKKYLKLVKPNSGNSTVNYSIINIDSLTIFSKDSNANEYLSFIVQNLKIRKTVTIEPALYTAFEDINLNIVFNNSDFKIIELEFFN